MKFKNKLNSIMTSQKSISKKNYLEKLKPMKLDVNHSWSILVKHNKR